MNWEIDLYLNVHIMFNCFEFITVLAPSFFQKHRAKQSFMLWGVADIETVTLVDQKYEKYWKIQ